MFRLQKLRDAKQDRLRIERKSSKAVLMSEKAEVLPSLFQLFLPRKRSVSQLAQHSHSRHMR